MYSGRWSSDYFFLCRSGWFSTHNALLPLGTNPQTLLWLLFRLEPSRKASWFRWALGWLGAVHSSHPEWLSFSRNLGSLRLLALEEEWFRPGYYCHQTITCLAHLAYEAMTDSSSEEDLIHFGWNSYFSFFRVWYPTASESWGAGCGTLGLFSQNNIQLDKRYASPRFIHTTVPHNRLLSPIFYFLWILDVYMLPYSYVGYQPPLQVHHSSRKCWKYIYRFDAVANDYILVNNIKHVLVGDPQNLPFGRIQ